MRDWDAQRVAEAARARLLVAGPGAEGPARVSIDSRQVRDGDLFAGLAGANVDGGRFAADALAAGAWGVLVGSEQAAAIAAAGGEAPGGAVLGADDPLACIQALARAWRRELDCPVIGITGSTGKTSTKDILAALLAPARRTVASRENLNTEIGVPLAMLEAPAGTEVLVLEMAMRGAGQVAELAAIAEPDVGVIVNVGPVHLERLGSVEAVAAAKAELVGALAPGSVAVVPAGEPLLDAHLRRDLRTLTFGDGGDVRLDGRRDDGTVEIHAPGGHIELRPAFAQAYQLRNLLAAVGAALAVDVVPSGAVDVAFSSLRGELVPLPGDVSLINDCYNANPTSVAAALEDLGTRPARRRVAVLGDMLELGPEADEFHARVGEQAEAAGVELLVTVGPLAAAVLTRFDGDGQAVADAQEAAAILPELLEPGDLVLVKGSRGVGLEAVALALSEAAD